MSAWWWVMIGLAAWLSVSLAVGLLLARFFRHAAQARDALDALAEERLAERQEPPQDGPRVALRASKRGDQAPGRAPRGRHTGGMSVRLGVTARLSTWCRPIGTTIGVPAIGPGTTATFIRTTSPTLSPVSDPPVAAAVAEARLAPEA
jgi:hypothetical protein